MSYGDAVEITKEDYERLASFRYALRGFLAFSEKAANDVGLTPQHHQAMLAIIGFPGRDRILVGELAERLMIRQHSAVGLANRLEAMGLVAREPDAVDHRRIYLSLTDHGQLLLDKLSIAHQRELDRVTPELIALLKASDRRV